MEKENEINFPTPSVEKPERHLKRVLMFPPSPVTFQDDISGAKSPKYSSSGKSELSESLIFFSSAVSIPQRGKNGKGEDAYFVTETVVGVADGVGGWASLGIDAGRYSRKLMRNAEVYVVATGDSDPKQILQVAHENMGKVVGSTTACIASIKNEYMHCANLGDSGFILLRYEESFEDDEAGNCCWKIKRVSRDQQHYFNCPYQLGTDAGEFPCDSDTYKVKLEKFDMLILATDGVFDNLFETQIIECVVRQFPNLVAVQKASIEALDFLSQEIANEARKISQLQEADTPFTRAAAVNNVSFMSGKEDDITVVVSIIGPADDNTTDICSENASPKSSSSSVSFDTGSQLTGSPLTVSTNSPRSSS